MDVMELWESDEMEEIKQFQLEVSLPTLSSTIWWTLLCAGPIGWLFIYIVQGRLEQLPLISVLAVLSAVLLTVFWSRYFAARKRYGKLLKEVGSRRAALWPMAFFCLAVVATCMIGGPIWYEKRFAPDGWLFYEIPAVFNQIQVYVLVVLSAFLFGCFRTFLRKESSSIQRIRSLICGVLCVVLTLLVMYVSVSHMVVVTEDSLVICSPLNPYGKEYKYEEIDRVEARFGTKRFTLNDYNKRGTFVYRVTINDKTVVFSTPTTNEDIERYCDTYFELEEFDLRLMALGISKISSDECAEYCDYDQQYVDRFLRIVHNK